MSIGQPRRKTVFGSQHWPVAVLHQVFRYQVKPYFVREGCLPMNRDPTELQVVITSDVLQCRSATIIGFVMSCLNTFPSFYVLAECSFHVLAEWARPCSHGEIIVDGPRRFTLTHILVQRFGTPAVAHSSHSSVSDAHAMFPVLVEGNQSHNSPWTIWDLIFWHGVTTHLFLRVTKKYESGTPWVDLETKTDTANRFDMRQLVASVENMRVQPSRVISSTPAICVVSDDPKDGTRARSRQRESSCQAWVWGSKESWHFQGARDVRSLQKFKFKNCEMPGRCLVLDTSKQMPARLTAMFVMKSDLDGC